MAFKAILGKDRTHIAVELDLFRQRRFAGDGVCAVGRRTGRAVNARGNRHLARRLRIVGNGCLHPQRSRLLSDLWRRDEGRVVADVHRISDEQADVSIDAAAGVPAGRGKRYSWGYGACPDLDDHGQLFKLLPAERELGMQLTSAYQLIPEQSTAAIIVHHPQAKYYAVRG